MLFLEQRHNITMSKDTSLVVIGTKKMETFNYNIKEAPDYFMGLLPTVNGVIKPHNLYKILALVFALAEESLIVSIEYIKYTKGN